MPNNLPVPSKAALRTLRKLALGTSCTVAFTTGMLTEDRRRRIHSASEVHANAKKIKSSRSYHSVEGPSARSFDEQVMRYRDDGAWKPSEHTRPMEPMETFFPVHLTIPPPSESEQSEHLSQSLQNGRPPSVPTTMPWKMPSQKIAWTPLPVAPSVPEIETPTPVAVQKASAHSRQRRLAADVAGLLRDQEMLTIGEAAVVRFLEALEEWAPAKQYSLLPEFVNMAIDLSEACQNEGDLQSCSKILDAVLKHGSIDEDTFFALGAEYIVKNLLEYSHDEITGNPTIEVIRVRKAAALYLTKFTEIPKVATTRWHGLGETLCAITCHQGLYDLTEAIYWRLDQCRGASSNQNLQDLFEALFQRGSYSKFIKAFRRFFADSSPKGKFFHRTGNMIIDATLAVGRFDMAEEALKILARLSDAQHFKCSPSWFAKVLKRDWESHHDITQTRAFFERLVPTFHCLELSGVVYAAVIQCCIKSSDEEGARSLYERLQASYMSDEKSELSIMCHFAYAKAMRNDWAALEDAFSIIRRSFDMADPNSVAARSYSASFVPIFKLFAKSHSVDETEKFLRTFIDKHNITLLPYLSTSMVAKYAEAHEVDSISRWLDYMTTIGSPPDAMFFNAILSNCQRRWNFSFVETCHLYRKVQEMEGRAANFVNDDTFSILRTAAMKDSRTDPDGAAKNLNLLRYIQHLNRITYDGPPKHNPLVNSRNVQEQMAVALSNANPGKALEIFGRAQKKSILPVDSMCICTAVKAQLQLDPNNVHAAVNLLLKSGREGRHVSLGMTSIFVHQLSHQRKLKRDVQVEDVAKNTFVMLEKRGINVGVYMVTHTMHILVRQGRFREAIEFWSSMSRRQDHPFSLDIVTLHVLLQAYLPLHDCEGIDWVVRMLAVHSLSPDWKFKKTLHRAWNGARTALALDNIPSDKRYCEVLEIAMQNVKVLLAERTSEKENFRVKTINIMEKAIEVQKGSVQDADAKWRIRDQLPEELYFGRSKIGSDALGSLAVEEELEELRQRRSNKPSTDASVSLDDDELEPRQKRSN